VTDNSNSLAYCTTALITAVKKFYDTGPWFSILGPCLFLFQEVSALPTFDISAKLSELKHTRQLGSQITLKGAALYDLVQML